MLAGCDAIGIMASFSENYAYDGIVEIRKGAVDGPIIGQSHVSYFHKSKAARKQFNIPISNPSHESGIYIVFKNNKKKNQLIMNVDFIELIRKNPM
jgi:cytochrome c